jgi:rhodanese-related sulfurtransferase
MRRILVALRTLSVLIILAVTAHLTVRAQAATAPAPSSATSIPESRLLQPEDLVRILKSTEKEKPVILQVGSRVMFSQVHIPGAEFAGPGSQASGIQSLESTVASLPKSRQIVLYCGCCPWNRCPNVGPAYKRLHDLGFTNVKVLYMANNFGDDWVSKGYPAVKGK